jgi:A/G-specific adenine glycosylase
MASTPAASPLVTPLLTWFAAAGRDLPWRAAAGSGTGPWAVLVSEVMLQQTPVARVLPSYAAWLTRWPTPAALAADSPGQAVRMWGKLGYPRRALRLHACAVKLVERYDGAVPDDVQALESLPGVGRYTARAVAAFAFGQRQPVVDTNVRRVVARAVLGQGAAGPPQSRDEATVEALLPRSPARAARFSAALMELGALVCTATAPACPRCPLRAHCAWQQAGAPAYTGPRVRPQQFAGTDRQARGRLLDVLRAADGSVPRDRLDAAWPDATQRARALAGLVADGLVVPGQDSRFALPD